MKDTDSTVAPQAPEESSDRFVSRKLIRPALSATASRVEGNSERRERSERSDRVPVNPNKRAALPEQTHAETFYYQKQMQSKTPVMIVLKDGEEVQGLIEWYDKNCLKLVREGGSNLLIYKAAIRYMHKAGEAQRP